MTLKTINPNHEVMQLMTDENTEIAMKILAILTWKMGGHLEVNHQDLRDFQNQPNVCMITHFHNTSIELKVVTPEEGIKLAGEAGGLPS